MQNVPQISLLLLAEGSASQNLILPLSRLSLTLSPWLQGGSAQHFPLLTSLVHSHLTTFRFLCLVLSGEFVH